MVRALAFSTSLSLFLVQPPGDARAEEGTPVAASDASAIVDQGELDAAVRAELTERVRVEVARDDSPGAPGLSVRLTVTRGVDVRARTLSLADVPSDRRARVLALAAADLLRDMPTLPPPAVSTKTEPPPPPPSVPSPAHVPPKDPELDLEGQVGGFLRAVPEGSTFLGASGKVGLCIRVFCPYVALALGTASTQTNIGSVSATLFRAGVGADLQVRPTPWLLLATGPSVRVGTFGASGAARSGSKASSFTAASFDASWGGQIAFRTGYLVWLFAEGALGGTTFGGTALVDAHEQASDRGFFFEATIGIRFTGDR